MQSHLFVLTLRDLSAGSWGVGNFRHSFIYRAGSFNYRAPHHPAIDQFKRDRDTTTNITDTLCIIYLEMVTLMITLHPLLKPHQTIRVPDSVTHRHSLATNNILDCNLNLLPIDGILQ